MTWASPVGLRGCLPPPGPVRTAIDAADSFIVPSAVRVAWVNVAVPAGIHDRVAGDDPVQEFVWADQLEHDDGHAGVVQGGTALSPASTSLLSRQLRRDLLV